MYSSLEFLGERILRHQKANQRWSMLKSGNKQKADRVLRWQQKRRVCELCFKSYRKHSDQQEAINAWEQNETDFEKSIVASWDTIPVSGSY